MKRDRNPVGKFVKWKVRLCVGGHQSVEFVDYWSTYFPVVFWQTNRLVLTLAIVNYCHIISIDFVLAYPQADIKTDIYVIPPSIPADFPIVDLPRLADLPTCKEPLLAQGHREDLNRSFEVGIDKTWLEATKHWWMFIP